MSDTRRSSYEPIIVALAPAALFGALVAHPYLPGRLPNEAAVAAAVAADTTRWGLVHLAAGVASGLVVLAFLAIRSYLRDAGDHRLSAVGVPFVVIGSTLFAMLPGMEFAALAAAETGTDLADIAAAQAALEEWFVPVLAIGALTFGIGVLAFIRGITVTGILSAPLTAVVVVALAVMALSRFVPLTAAQFYLQSAAGILALWPLAYHMWRRPTPGAAAQPGRAQAVRS
ncbi:MAG: hypothetical protein GEU81_18350 [Nitriliruptorales bacterium]|nr:hypothetical protein [Nitriliruptorales bacterium]